MGQWCADRTPKQFCEYMTAVGCVSSRSARQLVSMKMVISSRVWEDTGLSRMSRVKLILSERSHELVSYPVLDNSRPLRLELDETAVRRLSELIK